eukprot:EC793457.1.p3 GENE.EC793457.1~~EC793457.1.p3  ORF type:complete len:99 (+),score=28.05 EC793457.1:263-559(+)
MDMHAVGLILLQLLTGCDAHVLVDRAPRWERALDAVDAVKKSDATAGEWPADVARGMLRLGVQCMSLYDEDGRPTAATARAVMGDLREKLGGFTMELQ